MPRNKLLIPVGAVRTTDGCGGLLSHDYGGERGQSLTFFARRLPRP